MKFNKTNSAGFLANHMARLFAQKLHTRLQPLGLAPAQFMVMLELQQKEVLTQKQLVENLNVEQATVANTLARMKRDGLVLISTDKYDQRSRNIKLSRKAIKLLQPATTQAISINKKALSSLTAAEQKQFADFSTRIIAALKSLD